MACADIFVRAGHSWPLTVLGKQNLGRTVFFIGHLAICTSEPRLSPDAVLLRMTAPGRAPLGSVP